MVDKSNPLDLVKLFQSVTGTLTKNRESLNEADTNNHDHGDNMVDTFEVITQAMKEKKGADPADQLEYAASILRQRKSGSAQLYARGLSEASREFQGQQVTPDNAMTLIKSLLGGGQEPQPQQQDGGIVGNLLGSLMGGSGGQQSQQADNGFGLDDVVNAGMAFFNTKSRGGGNLEAIVSAVVAGSAMGGGYRQQSGNLVATALMQAVKGMIK